MKVGGFTPETVAVAPTSTVVATVDARRLRRISLHLTNLDATQTFNGVIETRLYDTQAWATRVFMEFQGVAPGGSAQAEIDVSTTGYVRLIGAMDGAGGDVSVSGSDASEVR